MKAVACLVLGASLFAAYAHAAESIVGPSGETLTVVKCKVNSRDCMAEANQMCRGSYQVYGSESHAGGAFADILPGPVTWYTMTFKCGKSDGRMPDFQYSGPRR
jgi:hypothetical protein